MKKVITYTFLVIFLALVLWTAWANTALELSICQIQLTGLPEAFEGFRIAHISDLHNAELGDDNSKLLSLLEKAAPDMIVITGDLVDCHHTDIELAAELMDRAVELAPCYYVTGNHEAALSDEEYLRLEAALHGQGVVILHDDAVNIEKDSGSIRLIGLDDPEFDKSDANSRVEKINSLIDGAAPAILLSHRPEYFEEYCETGVELVFSGHAHGGQFRLPFIGGIYAPGQGLLPEFDAGLYSRGDTQMLLSRGIGNSLVPIRFNNRPELIVAVLNRK